MKIGSLELSTPTFVYATIIAVLALLVPTVLLSRLGAIRESWQRDTIINAAVEGGDSLEGGIAACKALIAADPSRGAPRLHLGCLLSASKNYPEARDAFEHVVDANKATAEEKSLGLTGAACALCLDGARDARPAHMEEAEKLLRRALEFKESPDALAALALLKSWKSGGSSAEVEVLVKQAFAAAPAPSPGLLAELYRLNGSILARNHKPAEAANSFLSVKVLDPSNVQMDDAARLTLLAALNEPGMDLPARRRAIEKMMSEIDKFGKSRGDALAAIGLAWHTFKDEPGYADANGPFEKSLSAFKQLLELNPKDKRAYRNYAALLEERAQSLSSELSVPVSGLNSETPRPSAWAPDVSPNSGGGLVTLPLPDQERWGKIINLLREEQTVWEHFLAQAEPDKEDKIAAKLRITACVRRKVLMTAAGKPPRRDLNYNFVPDPADLEALKPALFAAMDMAALDESGHGHYVLALVLIEKGDLAAARAALVESSKRGFKTPEQSKLLAALDVKTTIVDAGPLPTERQFGAAPLIHASFETPLGLGALKNLKVTLNGKEVPAIVFGSEILYTPREAEMTGGAHVVKISAADAAGAAIVFPQFTYLVDKDPPEWSVEPAAGAIASDAIFSVKVTDPSGIDWGTLSAGMRSSKSGNGAPFDVAFVKEGRYSHSLPAIKVKSGDAVLRSPFKLAGPNALQPGEYKLWIDVRDLSGNALKDEKLFIVK